MGFTVTNIRHVSVGESLRESNIKHLQDSRKQDRKKRERETERKGWMTKGREEKRTMKAVEEVIVSHAWREKVGTLIKK